MSAVVSKTGLPLSVSKKALQCKDKPNSLNAVPKLGLAKARFSAFAFRFAISWPGCSIGGWVLDLGVGAPQSTRHVSDKSHLSEKCERILQ